MRLLHTSDWHIGRSLHGTDLLAEQEAGARRPGRGGGRGGVDVVLVAGDVYDRAVPSADATAVLSRVVARLRRGRCDRRADPGQPRLRPPAGHLLRAARGRWAARPRRDPAARRAGPAGRRARRRRDLRAALPRAGGRPLRAGPAGARAATRPCSPRRWTGCGPTCSCAPAPVRWCWRTPSSAAAQPSESERDISVGGVDLVPAAVFDGVDYVALGHLHRPADAVSAAALQRLAAGLLLRRGRASRSRPGWSTSTPPAWPTSVRCRCRPRAR